VLSELRPIVREEIRIGIHGLLVKQADQRGLLLPQVAMERNWSPERFLEEACVKAGLDAQAWRDPQTELFGFETEVFSETDFAARYSSST
jgi:uncharacterized protein (TIGR00296 family)